MSGLDLLSISIIITNVSLALCAVQIYVLFRRTR